MKKNGFLSSEVCGVVWKTIFLVTVISTLSFLLYGCDRINSQKIVFATEYQAVFLDSGQVFFGKLENAGSDYPLLKSVYYVQNQTIQETKEVKSTLIKRGNEWHKPDQMYINSKHIVMVEAVGPDSKVAELIKAAQTKKAGEQP
jgi:hypothetical protein